MNLSTKAIETNELKKDIVRHISDKLVLICQKVLNIETVNVNHRFFEIGGDSLLSIHYISEISNEFGVEILSNRLLKNATIHEHAEAISQDLRSDKSKPTPADKVCNNSMVQNPVQGHIPVLPNRYSYFYKRKRNLDYWFVSTQVLETLTDIDIKILQRTVNILVNCHDVLRLQLIKNSSGDWEQIIAGPDIINPIIQEQYDETHSSKSFNEYVNHKREYLRESLSFPGELFKVLCIKHLQTKKTVMVVIFHHLLVDAYSFRMIVTDLFNIYKQISIGHKGKVPVQSTSYFDYCFNYINYCKSIENDSFEYWKKLPWSEVKTLKTDYPENKNVNVECFSKFVVKTMSLSNQQKFIEKFPLNDKYQLIEIILCAVAGAYFSWTKNKVLLIDMVFHGRKSFSEGIDLTRTAGWLSETTPLLLPASLSLKDLLSEIQNQITSVNSAGNCYGYLKYLSKKDEIIKWAEEQPSPEISFNYIPPSIQDYQLFDIAYPSTEYDPGCLTKGDTERVFLLSGGAFFKESKFHLSWDYSSKLFNSKSIETFTNLCMEKFHEVISILGESTNEL